MMDVRIVTNAIATITVINVDPLLSIFNFLNTWHFSLFIKTSDYNYGPTVGTEVGVGVGVTFLVEVKVA